MNYVLTAEKVSRSCDRLFLKFDSLFSSPAEVIKDIGLKLEVSFQKSFEEIKNDLGAFLDRGLKHHEVSRFGYNAMETKAQELYQCFCAAAGKKTDLSWEKKTDNIEADYLQMYSFFLNKDLQDIAACPSQLEDAQRKIDFLEESVAGLAEQNDQLYAQIPILQDRTKSLQSEIKMMRETRAWRFAELLRRVYPGRSDNRQ
jgi:septal ring factor EnvC (AmiA/AmiB activator)